MLPAQIHPLSPGTLEGQLWTMTGLQLKHMYLSSIIEVCETGLVLLDMLVQPHAYLRVWG